MARGGVARAPTLVQLDRQPARLLNRGGAFSGHRVRTRGARATCPISAPRGLRLVETATGCSSTARVDCRRGRLLGERRARCGNASRHRRTSAAERPTSIPTIARRRLAASAVRAGGPLFDGDRRPARMLTERGAAGAARSWCPRPLDPPALPAASRSGVAATVLRPRGSPPQRDRQRPRLSSRHGRQGAAPLTHHAACPGEVPAAPRPGLAASTLRHRRQDPAGDRHRSGLPAVNGGVGATSGQDQATPPAPPIVITAPHRLAALRNDQLGRRPLRGQPRSGRAVAGRTRHLQPPRPASAPQRAQSTRAAGCSDDGDRRSFRSEPSTGARRNAAPRRRPRRRAALTVVATGRCADTSRGTRHARQFAVTSWQPRWDSLPAVSRARISTTKVGGRPGTPARPNISTERRWTTGHRRARISVPNVGGRPGTGAPEFRAIRGLQGSMSYHGDSTPAWRF